MIIRTAILMAVTLTIAQIWAFPLSKPGCNSTGYDRNLNDLVHQVSIMGTTDDRVALPQLQLPEQKNQQIRMSFGRIHCPWLTVRGAAASIIGSDVTLATAAHVFYDEAGQPEAPFEEWKKCYFKNYNSPANKVELKFAPGTFEFGNNPGLDRNDDFVIIRLARKIPGAKGFAVDPGLDALDVGRTLINLSRPQVGMKNQVADDEVVAQRCTNKRLFWPTGKDPTTVFLSDCDSSGGASGSILVAEMGDSLVAAGIVRGGMLANDDFREFDPQKVYTRVRAIDGRIMRIIERISGGAVRTAVVNP